MYVGLNTIEILRQVHYQWHGRQYHSSHICHFNFLELNRIVNIVKITVNYLSSFR